MREQTVAEWLDALASDAPAPGGGAAAALGGALGAALVSMVARFTTGRAAYAAVAEEVATTLEDSERLRAELTELAEADAVAYRGVAAAYRLPRHDEEARTARSVAIQAALADATEVPLQIAEACQATVMLAQRIAEIGNHTVRTDAGAAALLAHAAQQAALLNVRANLALMHDPARREAFTERMEQVERDGDVVVAATLALM